jgi:hypothetical protein
MSYVPRRGLALQADLCFDCAVLPVLCTQITFRSVSRKHPDFREEYERNVIRH